MAGIAVGDALGRPVEGLREVPDSYIDEMIELSVLLLYSDDTVLSIALAESLLACGRFDGDDMSRRFAEAWATEPERGYGSNVVTVFGAVRRGADWKATAENQFDGSGSYGNGGAMRVAPARQIGTHRPLLFPLQDRNWSRQTWVRRSRWVVRSTVETLVGPDPEPWWDVSLTSTTMEANKPRNESATPLLAAS